MGRQVIRTYILDLLLGDLLDALANLSNLEGCSVVDEGRASELHAGGQVLAGLESTEAGEGSSLLDLLCGDLAGSNLLDSLDNLLGGLTDSLARLAGNGDVEETSVGVGDVLGRDLDARDGLSGLGEDRGAGSPLDAGLTTKEGSEDSELGLVARGAEGARAREANHDGVARDVADTLLTSKVLGLLGSNGGEGTGGTGGRDVAEELANPLGDICAGVGAAGDDGNGGLGISSLGEFSDSLSIDVVADRDGRGRSQRVSEATVESNAVHGFPSLGGGVRRKKFLIVLDMSEDEFLQFVT